MRQRGIDTTKIKAIVFDFDGVIVESNQIKHEAFEEIFKDYPAKLSEIMQYHRSHNAVDRYKKFAHIAQNILMLPGDTQDTEKKWADRFATLTREKIIQCQFVEGAESLLDYLKGRIPMYLASATPKSELDIILMARNLETFFTQVYGSPAVKSEVLKNIRQDGGFKSNELLFVGDSKEDLDSALSAGVSFVGRLTDFHFEGVPTYDNLVGLCEAFQMGGRIELSREAF